jgi:hypothetical protein
MAQDIGIAGPGQPGRTLTGAGLAAGPAQDSVR